MILYFYIDFAWVYVASYISAALVFPTWEAHIDQYYSGFMERNELKHLYLTRVRMNLSPR